MTWTIQIKASPTPSTSDLKEIATLEKGRIDTENTIRTSLFQAVGGLLVFVTLGISWRTLQVNEEKQAAERFSKAVEQLGKDDNIHVRLGGIYALEQIAKDAEEKYYWQVMETLTSYVRVRSPWNKEKEAQVEQEIPPLPIDIQAVMTVLARRKHSYGHPLERRPIDLSGADLRRLQLLPETQLNQANLREANLQGASLEKVNLQGAILCKGNLQDSQLKSTNLDLANLNNADLSGVDLRTTRLSKVDLSRTNLVSVNLSEKNLQGTVLREADLWNADLQGANLEGVNLQGAKLQKAKLQGTKLKDANLKGVKFKVFDSSYVAEFGSAEVVGLTWEQLNSAAFYEKDGLPSYLRLQPLQSEYTLTTALNAIRVLAASYKSE